MMKGQTATRYASDRVHDGVKLFLLK